MNKEIKLDKYQKKVIKSNRNNILVIAGAGSGKTCVIVEKIKYLINVKKIDKKDILCISFTNYSCNSLRKKLNIDNIDILTFHKLALKIIGNKKELLTEDMLTDIIIDSFSNDKLFGLYKINKEEMYLLIKTFINLFKSKNYNLDKFYEFLKKANVKEKELIKEIMKCYICYESYLNKENLIDFNDMINLAIKYLDKSKIRYKYIIIDEYQDTSYTKFLLIKKLLNLSDAKLLAVGDDFQSIYRFSGTDIKIITNFKRYFPFAKIIKLKYTYRNSKELINIAGKFIMKNKGQIYKNMKSKIRVKNPVEIIYYNNLNESILKVIKEENIDDLLILSRNNNDLLNINIDNVNYRKMTIHKSKGLEAKYVFLVNVSSLSNGFPNKYKDHEILKFVNNYKEYYPYEEERRLFYVALTRCLYKIYIFALNNNESIFVKEIKRYKNVIIREK